MNDGFLEIEVEDVDYEIELELDFAGEIIASGTAENEVYDGVYTIIPSAIADKVLPTAEKLMENDLTVKKIPYSEVSNNVGGTTVTIGGDI